MGPNPVRPCRSGLSQETSRSRAVRAIDLRLPPKFSLGERPLGMGEEVGSMPIVGTMGL